MLFSEPVLESLRQLPGASHSFARQLAHDDAAPLRALIEDTLARVPEPARGRWGERLTSVDNRVFFQAFAELATARLLLDRGWRLDGFAEPGSALALRAPDGVAWQALAFGFIRQVRPVADAAMTARLARALDRVSSRTRIAVLVRRWLPHDFDPEPIRQAIDLWLAEVDRGTWDGRYAAYEDGAVSLEFALTGERTDRGIVAFTLGPFDGQRVLEALERRVVYELDAHRLRGGSGPLLVSAVADQPWRISRGYLRGLLLGTPRRQVVGEDGVLESLVEPTPAPSLFRDPVYRDLGALLLVERPADDPAALAARSYLHPWARRPLDPAHLPAPVLGVTRREGEAAVVRWL